jgi:hypothetical protein
MDGCTLCTVDLSLDRPTALRSLTADSVLAPHVVSLMEEVPNTSVVHSLSCGTLVSCLPLVSHTLTVRDSLPAHQPWQGLVGLVPRCMCMLCCACKMQMSADAMCM